MQQEQQQRQQMPKLQELQEQLQVPKQQELQEQLQVPKQQVPKQQVLSSKPLCQQQALRLFYRKQPKPEPTGMRSTVFFSWIFLQ
jgi:hypothetical protein